MDGKTVIITGATGELGSETAKELAKLNARIILACRNLDKAKEVKDDIIQSTNNQNIVLKKLDLASQKSIREFAADILKTEQKLHVLIHNAGSAEVGNKITEDGLETNIAVSHFGPFLLTHLLIELLKRSAPSRIIIVSSKLYIFANLSNPTTNTINPKNCLLPAYTYIIAKHASICFTKELARRLENTGVTANCLHPGVVDTGIFRYLKFPLSWFVALIRPILKTPQQGCRTTVYLADSEDVNGVSGKYFRDCKEAWLNGAVQNENTQKKIWELSKELAGLRDDDPRI